MIPHGILTLYTAKMIEYGIAVLFLLAFIPFWRFVQGPSLARTAVRATAAAPRTTLGDWFRVPADRLFHRGHAWAQPDTRSDLVTVGLNEFAASLVGPLQRLSLPSVGATLGQGERGWRLVAEDGRSVEMLAPVDGAVVEINPAVMANPAVAVADPFGDGWLMKVRPRRMRANTTGLLSGDAARRWMQDVAAGLQAQFATGLGAVAQDGGTPVAGMARAIDAEHWDRIAAGFLLTDEEHAHA